MHPPSPTEPNGRDPKGRFASGNRLARGNPHAAQVGRLRAALFDAVSPEDIQAVIQSLIDQALAGDIQAIRELFLRVLGKPLESDVLERLERMEEALAHTAEHRVR